MRTAPRVRRGVRKLELRTGIARRRARRRGRSLADGVFLWIPKTAGTSLWALLEARGGNLYKHPTLVRWAFPDRGLVSFGHMRYADLVQSGLVSRDFDDRAHKFCVVRDPYDRAVSLFHYLGQQRLLSPDLTFEGFTELLRDRRYEPIGLYNTRGLSQCNPQLAWILDDTGEPLVDEIRHFEDLAPLLHSLQDRFGIEGHLPHENRSTRAGPNASHYASARARRNVAEAYAEDFEAFGYPP